MEPLRSLNLDLPPSCIEFWPLNPRYAVVGTYNLEKSIEEHETSTIPEGLEEYGKRQQQRNGSLILAEVDGDEV